MRWLDAPQCAETTCSDILKSTVTYNEVECKKDSKDDQQVIGCILHTFSFYSNVFCHFSWVIILMQPPTSAIRA